MKIHVEGWRFIPHAYSITNQFQLLELLKRSQLEITHQDIPGLKPQWKHLNGLFPSELETQLQQIPQAINPPADFSICISTDSALANSRFNRSINDFCGFSRFYCSYC